MASHGTEQFGIDDRCDLLEAAFDLRWERQLADAVAEAVAEGDTATADRLRMMQAFSLDEWLDLEDAAAVAYDEAPASN